MLAVLSGGAYAANPPPSDPAAPADAGGFARLDKNGDGVLTADEMPGHKSAPKPEQ